MKKAALFLLLALVAGSVEARNHWVTNNPSDPGSDSNHGRRHAPYLTIQHALDLARAGDKVFVMGTGTPYSESMAITNTTSTSWGDAIEIIGLNRPEVTGFDTEASWTLVTGSDIYWTFADAATNITAVQEDGTNILEQIGETWMDLPNGSWPTIYGALTNGWEYWRPDRLGLSAKYPTDGTNEMSSGTYHYDDAAERLYIQCTDDANPSTHTISVARRKEPHLARFVGPYIKVRGFKFSGDNVLAYTNWAGVQLSGSYVEFSDNIIIYSGYIGLSSVGYGFKIYNNTVNWCASVGISGTSDEVEYIGNTSNYNNHKMYQFTWQAAGMKVIPRNRWILIRDHTSLYNWGNGIWTDSSECSQVRVEGCLAAYNKRNGYSNEYGHNIVIVNCIFAFNLHNGVFSEAGPGIFVAHNTIYQNGGTPVYLSNYPRYLTTSATSAARPDTYLPFNYDLYATNFNALWPANDNQIIGNIFMNNNSPTNEYADDAWGAYVRNEISLPATNFGTGTWEGRFSDFNFIYKDPTHYDQAQTNYFFHYRNQQEFLDVAAWQAVGHDTHSIFYEDPLFTDPDNLDFSLQATSPATNLVPILFEVSKDRAGDWRWLRTHHKRRSPGAYRDPTYDGSAADKIVCTTPAFQNTTPDSLWAIDTSAEQFMLTSFTATDNAYVCGVDLHVNQVDEGSSPTGRVVVSIWSSSAGAPDAKIETCTAVDIDTFPVDALPDWTRFTTIAGPYGVLIDGSNYWVVAESDTSFVEGSWEWSYDSVESGENIWKGAVEGTWAVDAADAQFAVKVLLAE